MLGVHDNGLQLGRLVQLPASYTVHAMRPDIMTQHVGW